MSRQAKLNIAENPDHLPDVNRRLEMAAELFARIAVRIAASDGLSEQQCIPTAAEEETA